MLTKNQKNIASFIHIGAFAKYIFPLGNFIIPLLIWTSNKDRSEFINLNGKQVINFQISILLYFILLAVICIPFAIHFGFGIEHMEHLKGDISPYDLTQFTGNFVAFIILGLAALFLLIIEIYATIRGAIKANDGEVYQYPLTIKFIK